MDLWSCESFHPRTGVGILKQYAGPRVHRYFGAVDNLRDVRARAASVAVMRWDSLFDDLESQLEREISIEESDVDAEEERLRLGRLSLRDRLVALHNAAARGDTVQLGVTLAHGERFAVRPVLVGRDWFSADVIDGSSRQRQCIIPLYSVLGVSIPAARAPGSLRDSEGTTHPELSARLGLTFVLRDLCRRRRAIDVVTPAGTLHGTIDRVGKDHFDLAMHEPGAQRRASEVKELRLLPLVSVMMVRLS
ncbi:hypothetical protein SAMN06296378_0472 [Salinibacterium xinjiangense]|uniref:Uncharacterized protein n=1 Tax=Salinibacterium xinjiangense TaxID=386302 RepID=A0A2C8YQS6_9MICO|nr:hypothetical protein SAMN06296378_0472 [Salinibacterium xinjiangense]